MLKLPRLRAKTHRDKTVSYWFDHGGKPRRWEPLGKVEARVLEMYKERMSRPKPGPGTVDEMLRDVIDSLRGKVSAGTLKNYECYRKHLAAVFRMPEDISQADVLRYLKTCPRMTFRNEVSLLSMGFVRWMDEGRLDFNPCFGVRCRRKGSKRNRLLEQAEIDRIIAQADERLSVAIELAYATGLRIGDLCALRWADLAGIVDTQKTGARQEFETTDDFAALLARARALQSRVASLYVLCDRRGRKWRPDTLRGHWNDACTAAGVVNAHPHDLRAAAATEVDRLYGQEAARVFLGHGNIRQTMTYLRGLKVNVVRPLARKAVYKA